MLKEAGCKKIITDKMSGSVVEKPGLILNQKTIETNDKLIL